jgi:drug/metabolite transporter (DMT)-like permease
MAVPKGTAFLCKFVFKQRVLNKRTQAHLALLFTNLFFAINLSAAKHLTNLQLTKPFGLNVVRVGVSMGLFWILWLFKPVNVRIAKQDLGRFLLCAITGVAINQLLFLKGLSLTYSIHASLLMLTTPILIVFIAAWMLRERLGMLKLFGLALGIIGAMVLVLGKENSGEGDQILYGDILIIINAISYTFYFVLVKPLMLKYEPGMIIRWIFTFGLFLILPFGWIEFTQIRWAQFDTIDLTCLALVVITGTFVAYLFNVYGIKILGASIAGFYIYTQPVFAALIAMIFLKEPLSAYKIVAALLIFAGVYFANRPTEKGMK